MEEHAAEDIKHFRPTTVRLPAARSLPLGLADTLTGAMPRSGAVLVGDAELRLQRRGRGLHARQRDAVLARRGHGLQGEPRPLPPPSPSVLK